MPRMPKRPSIVCHTLIALYATSVLACFGHIDLAVAQPSEQKRTKARHAAPDSRASTAQSRKTRTSTRSRPAEGATAPRPHSGLPATVTALLAQAKVPLSATSFYVIKQGAPAPVVTWNAQAPMNPASTMKLVTTFAGLQLLGPAFRWQTSLYAEREPDATGTVGNVYLRGHGDPKLVPEEMVKLVSKARRSGVSIIAGDVVLDRSYFEDGLDNGATIDGEVQRAYNVAPDALLYSFKTLTFTLTPDPARQAVSVSVMPPLAQLRVDNRLTLDQGRCGDWRATATPSIRPQSDGTVLASFDGIFAADCGEQTLNLATLTHNDFIGGGFVAEWQAAGGLFARPPVIRSGRVPRPAFLMARHYGLPLADIVRDINKYSNNVMARQLFLTIGAEIDRQGPASTAKSAAVIGRWLARQGMDMAGLVLENGSGLSRRERISAYDLARLLQQAAASEVAPYFIGSLPVLGIDGTLRNRLAHSPAIGSGHLKTGTLADVRALAGYMDAVNGDRYVVVALINHPNASQAQAAHDALLEWVHRGAPPTR
ncbi:D-alanyl-D-alanine carboxypeptidase/D-alanyl-D-alanine-endopeptidase (penicillin-binding protein 4) [Cupriavidus gilardii J11]|uniref:D-alanyl-D-alanine carboxypeptidase/D-alanyl-D-alanine-endopeptidase (Penicillin-binding protein 4) n=1 Tax=Cupriavidus gilardii J11 TaxID=936133 RepID=A0A562BGL3_9BURK|nr:D-alanyl-D-alanine carboxypeptidase/D-alanyl-D-alanine-endopeptidase [Cupriavidus gilardii]TWG84272.1 D-alanyl-D-alanine carboxypeptidase/D-alanyl-D-alanine-endopeptidase (penicillin-binding protein 4) [Cupriavidus gilardii J11]